MHDIFPMDSLAASASAPESVTSRSNGGAKKTVHVLYELEYELDPASATHLPDLRIPMQELGYHVVEHFVSPETVAERTKDIPRADPNHIVFLHLDMPSHSPMGTKLEAPRYMEENFKYVVGLGSRYSENTAWKSVMNDLFAKHGVRHAVSIRVESRDALNSAATLKRIETELKAPYFVKVDDGYNSLGLSNACVLHSVQDVRARAEAMIAEFGPVVIQRFLGGREFTVAVTKERAYQPVERIFAEDQLVSPSDGTPTEVILGDSELERVLACQQLAMAAFRAVEGTSHGRVDLREDPETGEIFVLEVNNACSLAPRSYFEMSVEACGSSKKKVLSDILEQFA